MMSNSSEIGLHGWCYHSDILWITNSGWPFNQRSFGVYPCGRTRWAKKPVSNNQNSLWKIWWGWFDESPRGTKRLIVFAQTVDEGLHKIHRCPLLGKVWCLQHIITSMLWPFLMHEILMSTVEVMETRINKVNWKWIDVSPGLTVAALYCRQAKLKWSLKSIVEGYKIGKPKL